jgi:hypothetical protein
MTTTAPRHDAPGTDERTRVAWTVYRDSLRDLQGRDYDDAEGEAWEALQRELRSIAASSTRRAPVG